MAENIGETANGLNPRFLQYARWRGMTPEEVMAADEEEFPGGKMAGFVCWNDKRIWEWCRETGTDRHYAGLFFDEISAWIEKRMEERANA